MVLVRIFCRSGHVPRFSPGARATDAHIRACCCLAGVCPDESNRVVLKFALCKARFLLFDFPGKRRPIAALDSTPASIRPWGVPRASNFGISTVIFLQIIPPTVLASASAGRTMPVLDVKLVIRTILAAFSANSHGFSVLMPNK